MTKGMLGVLLGVLFTVGAAGTTKSTKSSGYTCSLTGKHVDQCCCDQQNDGKLYCTLAKKTVDPCCCKAAPEKATRRVAPTS